MWFSLTRIEEIILCIKRYTDARAKGMYSLHTTVKDGNWRSCNVDMYEPIGIVINILLLAGQYSSPYRVYVLGKCLEPVFIYFCNEVLERLHLWA